MDEPPTATPAPISDQAWAAYGNGFAVPPRPVPRRNVALRLKGYLVTLLETCAVAAAVWTLVPSTLSPFARGSAAALAGLATCLACVHVLERLMYLEAARNRPRPSPETDPPMYVLHGPPPEPPDPQVQKLEAKLLLLCRQDWKVLTRLVEHERVRHPWAR